MIKKNKYVDRQKMWFYTFIISIGLNMAMDGWIAFAILSVVSAGLFLYNWLKGVSYKQKISQKNFDDIMDNMKRNTEAWQKRAKEQNSYSYKYHNNYKQSTKLSIRENQLVIAFGLMKLKLDSTPGEIKKTYRKLVLKWHPDRWTTDTEENQVIAERNFKKLNNAYNLIKQHKNIT